MLEERNDESVAATGSSTRDRALFLLLHCLPYYHKKYTPPGHAKYEQIK